jgi:hypothetical protein
MLEVSGNPVFSITYNGTGRASDPSAQKQGVDTRKPEISTWEELLDLWREFSSAPSRNYAYRAPPTVNRS